MDESIAAVEIDVQALGQSIVFVAGQFSHLRVPSAVVGFSFADFQWMSFPAFDSLSVDPIFVNTGSFESTIHDEVSRSALSDQPNVVDGESKWVLTAGPFKF